MPPLPSSLHSEGAPSRFTPNHGDPRSSATGAAGKRPRYETRLARIYDSEILPLWSHHFARLLLSVLHGVPDRQIFPATGKATVLDLLCGTGNLSVELLRRCGEGVRLIAIDPSSTLLDVARQKVGTAAGKRIFFRSESAEPELPFPRDVYDLVVSNLGLCEVAEPRRLLAEMVRVTRPGGRVVTTLPLQGTHAEFLDLFEQVLDQVHGETGGEEVRGRLSSYRATLLSPGEARSWLVEAGLCDALVEVAHFTLLFAGGREFFFAPVIEFGPLQAWKDVVAPVPQEQLQDIFQRCKDEIDRVCLKGFFALTVRAGCLSGRKPLPEEVPPDESAAEVELNSAEIDILALVEARDKDRT